MSKELDELRLHPEGAESRSLRARHDCLCDYLENLEAKFDAWRLGLVAHERAIVSAVSRVSNLEQRVGDLEVFVIMPETEVTPRIGNLESAADVAKQNFRNMDRAFAEIDSRLRQLESEGPRVRTVWSVAATEEMARVEARIGDLEVANGVCSDSLSLVTRVHDRALSDMNCRVTALASRLKNVEDQLRKKIAHSLVGSIACGIERRLNPPRRVGAVWDGDLARRGGPADRRMRK